MIKLSPARCGHYPNQPGFLIAEDFGFVLKDGGAHTMPEGFWFNGASIPAPFWQLTFSPFDPRIIEAAAIHDWLYTSKIVTRDVADAELKHRIQRAGWLRREAIAKAVELFGGYSWTDTMEDADYLRYLKVKIANSGRSLTAYGLA